MRSKRSSAASSRLALPEDEALEHERVRALGVREVGRAEQLAGLGERFVEASQRCQDAEGQRRPTGCGRGRTPSTPPTRWPQRGGSRPLAAGPRAPRELTAHSASAWWARANVLALALAELAEGLAYDLFGDLGLALDRVVRGLTRSPPVAGPGGRRRTARSTARSMSAIDSSTRPIGGGCRRAAGAARDRARPSSRGWRAG